MTLEEESVKSFTGMNRVTAYASVELILGTFNMFSCPNLNPKFPCSDPRCRLTLII